MERKCTLCLQKGEFSKHCQICNRCRSFLKDLTGRDYSRERVRILGNHTCAKCQRKWNGKERRFDIHHTGGLCGKKSRKYDRNGDKNLQILCHECHMSTHGKSTKPKVGIGFTITQKKQMFDMRNENPKITYDEIALHFGVKSAAIHYHVKRYQQGLL